jgi:hypothetical protein
MPNRISVIPSEVEESRGESLKVIPRDPSTSLRMTAVQCRVRHCFDIPHSCFVIRSRLFISV